MFQWICSCISDEEFLEADEYCSWQAEMHDGADQSLEVYGDCMAEAFWDCEYEGIDED